MMRRLRPSPSYTHPLARSQIGHHYKKEFAARQNLTIQSHCEFLMPHSLQRGQRLKLTQITTSKQFMVALKAVSPSLKFDISCFGLDAGGKLSDDRFFVFFNQPSSPNDAIKMLGARDSDTETFGINLDRLPSSVQRLMWVISVDGSGELKQLSSSYLRFMVAGQEVARFSFSGQDLSTERALMVTEVYFKDEWRVNAVGQGFAGGLDAVLAHFGGEEVKESQPQPSAPQPSKTAILAQAHAEFGQLCKQTKFDGMRWQSIRNRVMNAGVPQEDLLTSIRPVAMQFLENLIEQSAADGIITPDEDKEWTETLGALGLPQDWLIPFHALWIQEKKLSAIRQGRLPSTQADVHFASDEICHLLVDAKHHKEVRGALQHIPVRLAATSKKLYIMEAGAGGKTVAYSNFLKVIPAKDSVIFELATKSGAGTYSVDNPALVDAVLTTLIKLNKRQILDQKERGRAIPQEVRIAVWQRDGGKCVQCGASGRGACLEYDHILPFSKGGASTVNNIRLLCRRCNLDKGGRI